MRVLIPARPAPDNFAQNVVHTLKRMGHQVYSLPEAPLLVGRLRRARAACDQVLRRAFNSYVAASEQHVVALARAVKPDVVLALTQQLTSQTLHELKRAGVRHRAVWWADCPANMQQMGILDSEWDALFLKDPDGVRKLRRVGLNAHLLHEAHNPDWHRPVASGTNGKIVIAGNFYGYRQYLVQILIARRYPLDLYGPPLPRWVDPAIAGIHSNRYLVHEEKSRAFGEGLVCLNSMHVAEGNSLNCRAFEVAGAGGLQLIEYRPMVEACFEPGKELLVFDSMDELFDGIERAQRAPEEGRKIREAGHRRAVREHTYRHRLEQIFRTLEAS